MLQCTYNADKYKFVCLVNNFTVVVHNREITSEQRQNIFNAEKEKDMSFYHSLC